MKRDAIRIALLTVVVSSPSYGAGDPPSSPAEAPGGPATATASPEAPSASLAALAARVVGTVAPVRTGPVAIVMSADDIQPFEESVERFRMAVSGTVLVESLAADRERWPGVRERLSREEPSVWVAVGPLALEQIAAAGLGQPVVFMVVPSPEETLGAGGVSKVAGVTMTVDAGAQLKEIKALLPGVQRLGIVHDPSQSGPEVAAAQEAARKAGLILEVATISDVTELGGALPTLLGRGIDALWLVPDRTMTPRGNANALEFIAATTLKAGVPVIGYADKLTEAGALFSLAPDYGEIGAQAAEMVRRVAAGEAPSDIGVQGARAVALSLNLKVARDLGIELPAAAHERAERVFQ